MNARIQELALQAELPLLDVDGKCKYGDTYFNQEKFAELIVQECVWQVVKDDKVPQDIQGLIGERFKQHFGVEE